MYYVYQNWQARGLRARIHEGSCKHCNDGKGRGKEIDPAHGKWHGPLESEEAARNVALAFGPRYDVQNCGCCSKKS